LKIIFDVLIFSKIIYTLFGLDVKTGFGPHPASYPVGTRGTFPGGGVEAAEP
jgi:hypothetical protein